MLIAAYKTQSAALFATNKIKRIPQSAVARVTPRRHATDYALAAIGLILVLRALVYTTLLHLGILIFRHRHTLRRSAPFFIVLLAMFLWRRWKTGED